MLPGKMPSETVPWETFPHKNCPQEIPSPRKYNPKKTVPQKYCPLEIPPHPYKSNFVKLPHVMEYFKGENFVNFNFRQS